jgi:hypothetical protein
MDVRAAYGRCRHADQRVERTNIWDWLFVEHNVAWFDEYRRLHLWHPSPPDFCSARLTESFSSWGQKVEVLS